MTYSKGQAWWNMPVTPALKKLRQVSHKLQAAWTTYSKPCLKKKKKNKLLILLSRY